MNFLLIVAIGLGIIFLEDSPKDLPTVIEDNLICRPANEGWCIGWREE